MANRFEKYGNPAAGAPAPTKNRFAKYADAPAPQQGPPMPDAATLRKNRLTAVARAGLPEMGTGDIFQDRFTLGLKGPTSGLANAVGGSINNLFGSGDDSSFGERYRAGETAYDQQLAEAEGKAGGAGTAASVAGMLTPGGAGANLIRGVPTAARAGGNILSRFGDNAYAWLRGPTAKAATDAAQLGAVQAAATSRGDTLAERVEDTASGAVESAAIGGATNKLLGKLPFSARRAARRADRLDARGPTPDALKDQSRQIFHQLEQTGTAFDINQAAALSRDLGQRLRHANIRAADMPVADDLLNHVGPMQLPDLQRYRTQASDLARSNDSRERRMAVEMLGAIDDFVGRQQPALTTLAPGELDRTWREARTHWRNNSLAADLGWNVDKATRRANAANSGGNIDNATRQNVTSVLNRVTKPGAYNPYSDATLQQMRNINDPGTMHNAYRYLGNKFGGTGPLAGSEANWLAGGGGVLTGLVTRDPTAAAAVGAGVKGGLMAVGSAAKARANVLTERAADDLIGNVARGGAPRLGAREQAILSGPPTRERLALMRLLNMTDRASSAVALGSTGD